MFAVPWVIPPPYAGRRDVYLCCYRLHVSSCQDMEKKDVEQQTRADLRTLLRI